MDREARARRRVSQLYSDLKMTAEGDPQHDVFNLVVPVLRAVVDEAASLSQDAVIHAVRGLLDDDALERKPHLRASDALLIVGQVQAALYREPEPQSRPSWITREDSW